MAGEDDLRATIAAAVKADETPTPAPAPDPTPAHAAVEAQPAAESPAPQAPDSRVRDEHGRFAPKEGAEAAAPDATPETPKDPAPPAEPNAQTPESDPQTTRPPASWSAEAKAAFRDVSPVIQAEVLKRERDIDRGLQERAQQMQELQRRYEPLEQQIAPHRDRWAMAGMDEAKAIGTLIAAQSYLERDPVNGIFYLARSYGVDLRQFAQGLALAQQPGQPQPQGGQPMQGQPGLPQGYSQPQPATLPPEFTSLFQDVQSLKQTLTERQQADQQARQSDVQSRISTFAADPAHLYFDNVRDDMAKLIEAGMATDLKDAYDRACWARPDIRRLIQADQSRSEQERQAREAAQRRQSAGSITGSPAPGAIPAKPEPAPDLRAEIKRAYEAASAQ